MCTTAVLRLDSLNAPPERPRCVKDETQRPHNIEQLGTVCAIHIARKSGHFRRRLRFFERNPSEPVILASSFIEPTHAFTRSPQHDDLIPSSTKTRKARAHAGSHSKAGRFYHC